jgi:hypothetical protein
MGFCNFAWHTSLRIITFNGANLFQNDFLILIKYENFLIRFVFLNGIAKIVRDW